MSEHDDIVARATRRAQESAGASSGHDDWGDQIATLDDTGDVFKGRYRGEAEDENYGGHGRRVHLAWDGHGQPCWVRGKWSLNSEFDRELPNVGDTLVIVVGEGWQGKDDKSGFYFGVVVEPCSEPLPKQPAGSVGGSVDDDLPFMPVL